MLRGLLLRHFFDTLVICSSVAMWAVPAWVLHSTGALRLGWPWHLAGVGVVYLLNRAVVRGARRRPTAWRRRYSAVALVLLLCSAFLLLSTGVFSIVRALAAVSALGGDAFVVAAFQWWGLSGMALVAATMLFGYTGGQRQLQVNRLQVPLEGWTGRLTVLQLSDIHVGQNLELAQLDAFVDRVNQEGADLICLTGDIADGPQADLETFFPRLGRLQARFGVYAILGNHDHYAGADRVEEALIDVGVTVLRDRAETIEVDGQRLHLIGLDDRGVDWARGMHSDDILERLLVEGPDDVPTLLLVHRPDVFRHAARLGVDLTLSGHTHGGQLAVPWFGGRRRNLAEFVTRFDRGWFHRGNSRLYVNCGLGVTAQRIRLFTPREISVFELCPELEELAADGGQTSQDGRLVSRPAPDLVGLLGEESA